MPSLFKIVIFLVLVANVLTHSNAMSMEITSKQKLTFSNDQNVPHVKKVAHLEVDEQSYNFLCNAAYQWYDVKQKQQGELGTIKKSALHTDDLDEILYRFLDSSTFKRFYTAQLYHARKLYFHDLFRYLKKKIKKTDLHVSDWNDLKFNSSERSDRTLCFRSAEYAVSLLTGLKNVKQQLHVIAIGCCPCVECIEKVAQKGRPVYHPLRPLYLPDETICTFGNFIKKTGKYYDNAVAYQLFHRSRKARHLAFYINMHHGSHVFVIEKMCDGLETGWRVYQSWQNLYTLNEWLGNDDWNKNVAGGTQTKWHIEYGKGNVVESQAIKQYIIDVIAYIIFCSPIDAPYSPESLPMYVKIFNVAQRPYA